MFDVAIGNNRAAILWTQFSSSFTLDPACIFSSYCYGSGTYVNNYQGAVRWIRLDNGAFQGGNVNIANHTYSGYLTVTWGTSPKTDSYNISNFQAAANDNNQIVFGWVFEKQGSQDHTIYGSVYDMTTGTKIGTDKTLLSESTRPVDSLQVGATTGRGMVLWRRNDGMILGRGVDTSNSNLLGTSNIETESGGIDTVILTVSDNKGIVTYRKDTKETRLKVIDLQSGQFSYPDSLNLGITNADMRGTALSTISGNKVLTTWSQFNSS
ncbi:hypothetical protein LEP1GSC112_0147, partial [Leptospira interrogans serovar Pomona str. UT364]